MFQPSIGKVFEGKGTPRRGKWLVVSALKASRMLLNGGVEEMVYRPSRTE